MFLIISLSGLGDARAAAQIPAFGDYISYGSKEKL